MKIEWLIINLIADGFTATAERENFDAKFDVFGQFRLPLWSGSHL